MPTRRPPDRCRITPPGTPWRPWRPWPPCLPWPPWGRRRAAWRWHGRGTPMLPVVHGMEGAAAPWCTGCTGGWNTGATGVRGIPAPRPAPVLRSRARARACVRAFRAFSGLAGAIVTRIVTPRDTRHAVRGYSGPNEGYAGGGSTGQNGPHERRTYPVSDGQHALSRRTKKGGACSFFIWGWAVPPEHPRHSCIPGRTIPLEGIAAACQALRSVSVVCLTRFGDLPWYESEMVLTFERSISSNSPEGLECKMERSN